MATVSFANDIAPTLFKYRGQMAWRLDLASYDDVKANANLIAGQLAGDPPSMTLRRKRARVGLAHGLMSYCHCGSWPQPDAEPDPDRLRVKRADVHRPTCIA
jgi:hypothetical protein